MISLEQVKEAITNHFDGDNNFIYAEVRQDRVIVYFDDINKDEEYHTIIKKVLRKNAKGIDSFNFVYGAGDTMQFFYKGNKDPYQETRRNLFED